MREETLCVMGKFFGPGRNNCLGQCYNKDDIMRRRA